MDIKNIFQSRSFKIILIIIGGLVVALLFLQAGIFIGYRKAAFSYQWGDNYYRTFGNPDNRSMLGIPQGGFFNPHGATGKIIKIDLPTFIIQGPDKVEKVILIKDDTSIMEFNQTLTADQLRVNDSAVIIGAPNDQSQIEAKIIRLLPTQTMAPGRGAASDFSIPQIN